MTSTITWPTLANGGKPSTTAYGKAAWKATLVPFGDTKISLAIDDEQNWRKNYMKHVLDIVNLQANCTDNKTVIASARAGLAAMNSSMLCGPQTASEAIITPDTTSTPVSGPFSTKTIFCTTPSSSIASSSSSFTIPHPTNPSKTLENENVLKQVSLWADYGCIEMGCKKSIGNILTDPHTASNACKDKLFVLLGATSALGPFDTLANLGATIACVSRSGKKLDNLIEKAQNSTSATLLLPEKSGGAVGGDLLADAPSLATWIASLDASKELVLCCLVYLDGEKHVRASVAMDCIVEYVMKNRKKGNVSLSYLTSPATAHVRSQESVAMYEQNLADAPFWHSGLRLVAGLANNSSKVLDSGLSVMNGLSGVQGPNYALAKTSQQWRAIVAKSEGATVSANHAPPARTESMISYPTIKAALNGMQVSELMKTKKYIRATTKLTLFSIVFSRSPQKFKPMVAFRPETASALMAGLLLNDLVSSASVANKDNKSEIHPMELFVQNAAHGGSWGCAYSTDSSGPSAYILGKISGDFTPEGSVVKYQN